MSNWNEGIYLTPLKGGDVPRFSQYSPDIPILPGGSAVKLNDGITISGGSFVCAAEV